MVTHVGVAFVCAFTRPNAVKWQAGKSISDRAPDSRGAKRKDSADAGSPLESGEGALSEIRATEVIHAGEEIT